MSDEFDHWAAKYRAILSETPMPPRKFGDCPRSWRDPEKKLKYVIAYFETDDNLTEAGRRIGAHRETVRNTVAEWLRWVEKYRDSAIKIRSARKGIHV